SRLSFISFAYLRLQNNPESYINLLSCTFIVFQKRFEPRGMGLNFNPSISRYREWNLTDMVNILPSWCFYLFLQVSSQTVLKMLSYLLSNYETIILLKRTMVSLRLWSSVAADHKVKIERIVTLLT